MPPRMAAGVLVGVAVAPEVSWVAATVPLGVPRSASAALSP